MSLNEFELLRHGDISRFLGLVLTQAPNIAPLFPVTVTPFFMFFGTNILSAYLVNSFYLGILLVSVFFMAEEIAGERTAIVAAFIVATFPAVVAYSRDVLLEFPLAALTSLSYLFFLKSDSFEKRKFAILFGVCAGLAVLTKTMGTVFFVMPFFFGIYAFIRGQRTVKANVVFSFLGVLFVASIYYVPNFKQIFGYLFHYGVGSGAQNFDQGASNVFSLSYWTAYLDAIIYRGVSVYYSLVFIVAAAVVLIFKGKRMTRKYWLLWLWFICGYILLSIPRNKGLEQYALPILPPLALITSIHISEIPWKPVKYVFLAAAFAVGLTNYVYQSKSERCLYDSYFFRGEPILAPEHSICRMQEAVGMASDEDWDILPLLSYMDNSNTDKSRTIKVLVAANHHFLNINNLKLFALLDGIKGKLRSDFLFEWIEDKSPNELAQSLNESDFVITKSGFQGPVFANEKNAIVKDLLGTKLPLRTFRMPDGSIASVYRCYIANRSSSQKKMF